MWVDMTDSVFHQLRDHERFLQDGVNGSRSKVGTQQNSVCGVDRLDTFMKHFQYWWKSLGWK